MFLCTLCAFSSNNRKLYTKHVIKFHDSPVFVCSIESCKRSYSLLRSFLNHSTKCSKTNHVRRKTIAHSPPAPDYSQQQTIAHSPPAPEYSQQQTIAHSTSSAANNVSEIFKNDFKRMALNLYADESIPRSKTTEILKLFEDSRQSLFEELRKQHNQRPDHHDNLLKILSETKFSESEYKFMSKLKTEERLVPLVNYVLSAEDVETRNTELVKIKQTSRFLKMVDLKSLFEYLFKTTNFLKEIIDYIDSLKNEKTLISNIIQTPIWKKKISRIENDGTLLLLPLIIYFDDFEPLNALGSHSGAYKVGAVYCKIACLPSQVQSKLNFIFLGSLFFSDDRKEFGNKKIFLPFIEMLNEIQTIGIPVNCQPYKIVKLIPVLITGDNLGLNSSLGFVESFNSSFYCRFCKSHKKDMRAMTTENTSTLRTEENYSKDCVSNNYKLTGIKENSVWNQLKNFHVTDNLCVDIMHDILEGVCQYDLTNIIHKLIYQYEVFDLETLNFKIKHHNFGPNLANTNIVEISKEMLEKNKIKTSASEMLNLFTHFSLIVGDFFDSYDVPEWSIYIKLREIMSIIFEKTIHIQKFQLLKVLISEHHELYIDLIGPLKPKHHFMVHYPRILQNVGPLAHISSIRFESFHKKFKHVAKNSQCRINLLHTFAVKFQIQISQLLANFESFDEIYKFSAMTNINPNKISLTLQINQLMACFRNNNKNYLVEIDPKSIYRILNCELSTQYKINSVNWVSRNSIMFKLENVIQTGTDDDDLPIFSIIKGIYAVDNEVFLCCKQLYTLGFDEHFYCYVVQTENFHVIHKLSEIFSYHQSYIFYGTKNMVLWQ